MAVAVVETAAVVVAATMVAAAADADLTANKRRRSITLTRPLSSRQRKKQKYSML